MHSPISLPFIMIILVTLAALSFLISTSETAVVGLSKLKLRHLVVKGLKRAKKIQYLSSHMDQFITAILILNNFVNIAISAIVTVLMVHVYGERWGVVISTFATTLAVLIFCEITPKILAIKHAERIALAVAPTWVPLIRAFAPVISVFTGISHGILKVFGLGKAKKSPLITEEELRMMIEIGREEGVLSDEEKRMLHKIFDFGDTRVNAIMVPREKIIGISISATADEIMDVFEEHGFTRLPVYMGSLERIVGVVNAKDLLYLLREKGLVIMHDIMQQVPSVPETMRVNELLRKFQAERIQMALVSDPEGRVLGLVTFEDLMEEIVGEIDEKRQRPRRK